ncbi:hypothetical protein ACHWQZ_G014033 [Mnemiopsis leidyi]
MTGNLLTSWILLACLSKAIAVECPFKAEDSVYGTVIHPAYTVEELEADMEKVFEPELSNSCLPTMRVYRSYGSGAVTTADLTEAAEPFCSSPECSGSKTGTLQAASCKELLQIRDEITSGGYTALCRHDLTNWNVEQPENEGCDKNQVCTDPAYSILLQRRLSPAGLRRSSVQGQSLRDAGVKIDSLQSSSWERSKKSALQVGHWYDMTVSDLKEQPFPLDNAVHNAMDYERKAGYEPATPADRYTDVKALMRVRTRKWLQENWEGQTAEGVRYAYSHGGTMQNALGHKFDEGDCAWLKPTENTYDLAEAVTVTLSNREFPDEMEMGTKKVDLFAVLSPEQTQKMGQCTKLRADMEKDLISSEGVTILAADTNKDLEITSEEFTSFCQNSLDTSRTCTDLWKAVLSLQANPYWKKDETATSFFIGEHSYFNGGWHEKAHSKIGWAFPWRGTTLDTIRSSVDEMKQVLSPVDEMLQANMDNDRMKAVMDCEPKAEIKADFSGCAASLLSYNAVPTNSRPEDDTYASTEHPILGLKYPFPTTIDITPVPNPLLKLAMCLVQRGHLTAADMAKKMGCELIPKQGCSESREQNGQYSSAYHLNFVTMVTVALVFNLS